MGYLHIENLYKNQLILQQKECYALEKIHGTSAHISFKFQDSQLKVTYFSGGEKYENFRALFDEEVLVKAYLQCASRTYQEIVLYGEACGGKQQGMKDTYGDKLCFVVFDVRMNEMWLLVPMAEEVTLRFGLEFVDYVKIPCTLEAIDAERDKPSVFAVRRGITEPKLREGVVLRPLTELTLNNGERLICKHKGEAFAERVHSPKPKEVNPDKLAVMIEANAIAEEWVVPMRLQHVLDKIQKPLDISNMKEYISAMIEDVYREAKGEIVESTAVKGAIARKTAELIKRQLADQLNNGV